MTTDQSPGGIEVAIQNYVSSLLDMNNSVTLFVRESLAKQYKKKWNTKNLKTVSLSTRHVFLMRRFHHVPYKIKSYLNSCDLIMTHNNFLTCALEKLAMPLITVCHSDKIKKISSRSNLICLSRKAMRDMVNEGIAKNRLFYLPHYFEIREEKPMLHKKTGEEKNIVISAAGRMVSKKRLSDFIWAAHIIQKKAGLKQPRFILAGTGEQQQELHQLAKKLDVDVEFPGWISDMHVFACRSDIFCLTSDIEPFGYVLCEMMEHGVACISTKTNGPLDILGNGKAGLYYDSGNYVELAEAISELITNPEKRKNQARLCYDRIRAEGFSKKLFQKRLREILNEGMKR